MPTILSSEFPYLVGYYGYITMPVFVIGTLFYNFATTGAGFSNLLVFPGFVVFNQGLNGLLKHICHQPRPDNQINIVEHDSKTNQNMGMPSGHSQSVAFSMTYLFLSQTNFYVNAVGLVMSGLTLAQRLVYRKHTPTQVVVGTSLGGLVGYIAHISTKTLSLSPTFLSIITMSGLIPLSFYIDHYNILEKRFLSLFNRED